MSQGHSTRYSNALDVRRVRTDGSSASASPKSGVNPNMAYEKYKASLHAFFEGKAPLPEHIRTLAPGAESDSKDLDQALRSAEQKCATKAEKKAPERSPRRLSSSSPNGYDIFIEAIKRSATPDEITRTVDALFEAGHQLPLDEEILSKALGHRNEDVVQDILEKLTELVSTQPTKSPRLLKTRIENTALLASSSVVKELCQSLRSAIGN